LAGEVLRDGLAGLTPDEERSAGNGKGTELGLDRSLADLLVAVVEREGAFRTGRLLPLLLERRRQDQLLARRDVVGCDDHLLLAADEIVHVVQTAALDVEGMAPESAAVRE